MGRNHATKFITDILNTSDVIREINRRLNIVCQILNEDVEVDFEILKKIIDEILDCLSFDDKYENDHPAFIYNYYVNLLLQATIYQEYLLERIYEILQLSHILHFPRGLFISL